MGSFNMAKNKGKKISLDEWVNFIFPRKLSDHLVWEASDFVGVDT